MNIQEFEKRNMKIMEIIISMRESLKTNIKILEFQMRIKKIIEIMEF